MSRPVIRRRGSRARMEAFVFTWKGYHQHAAALERAIAPVVPVTVINSDPSVAHRHPGWVTLDDTAYFAAQWNEARRRFTGDILFHIQADASSAHLATIIDTARSMFAAHALGVYEPAVDYTDIQYDTARLRPLQPDVFEVPWTDCTCWFIARDVLTRVPPFDLSLNRFGWGLCPAIGAAARAQGLMCVRDHRLPVVHPRGRGYSSSEALSQMYAYLNGLPVDIKQALAPLRQAYVNLRVPPPRV
jgi:hypothetical protein